MIQAKKIELSKMIFRLNMVIDIAKDLMEKITDEIAADNMDETYIAVKRFVEAKNGKGCDMPEKLSDEIDGENDVDDDLEEQE